jgi:hypothetical protein
MIYSVQVGRFQLITERLDIISIDFFWLSVIDGDSSQPSFLPKHAAMAITTIVVVAGASDLIQLNNAMAVECASVTAGNVIASLFCPARNAKTPPAEFRHFGHERQ